MSTQKNIASAPVVTSVTDTADTTDHILTSVDVTNLYGLSWDNSTFQVRMRVLVFGPFSTYSYTSTLDWIGVFRRDTGTLSLFGEASGNSISGVAPTGGVIGSARVFGTYGFVANGDNKTIEFHATPLRNAAMHWLALMFVDAWQPS